MSRNRKQIQQDILDVKNQIKDLDNKLNLLRVENLTHCDNEQWYTEEEEERVVSKRPKVTEMVMVGKIHWKEDFVDQDDPKSVVTIERSSVVRYNGTWYL